jgi:hypothetical protein
LIPLFSSYFKLVTASRASDIFPFSPYSYPFKLSMFFAFKLIYRHDILLERADLVLVTHSGCQKNVQVGGRFFATTTYAAILFSEHIYDKRYKCIFGQRGRMLKFRLELKV